MQKDPREMVLRWELKSSWGLREGNTRKLVTVALQAHGPGTGRKDLVGMGYL